MFAFLGPIAIGMSAFTGPTKSRFKEKSTLARINVAEGKPVLQDRGDELIVHPLHFFFDETFCDPTAELAKLRAAREAREPLPLAYGDGDYTGAHFVVEEIDGEVHKTTPLGAITRIDVDVILIEAPVTDLGALDAALAIGRAVALSPAAALNTLVKLL